MASSRFSESRYESRDTDDEPTPRPLNRTTTATAPADTPAARLRALLTKMPNQTPVPVVTPPEMDLEASDVERTSASLVAQPSMAQESLKDLLSSALRDTTPRKPVHSRIRRNSIDASDLEASPVKGKAKMRAKRKSLSDEEVEVNARVDRNGAWFSRMIVSC